MLTIAAQSFLGSQGGIARVCDLSARVALEAGLLLSLLSVEDEGGRFARSGLWKGYRGSRTRFVLACARSSIRGDQLFYDQLGTARAHIMPRTLARSFGVWIHGIEVWDQLRPDRLRVAHRAGFMLANSDFTRERAIGYDKVFSSARVCWLGTAEDEPPENPGDREGPPIALIVGRLDDTAYKGHRELIEVWPSVVRAIPDARLVIAGAGPSLERHRSLAAASSAADRIDILGFVEEDDLPKLWRSAHIFAMPSRGEGFGIAYIEAMRWGVPIVASVHDAAQEINVHAETGFNVNLDRVGELGEALILLLRNRELGRRMGAAGQKRWRAHFCYSAFKARFLEELRCLVKS